MKIRQIMVLGLAVIFAMSLPGLAMARGGNGGGKGNGIRTNGAGTASTTTTRPADSQRRDGTFSTTGTTANGGTTRPSNGKGLQDGSRLTTPTSTVTPEVSTQ